MITRKTFLKRFFIGIKGRKVKKFQRQKLEKVLIALDYDPGAQKVAETGFSFSKAMKAKITLLHVMADPRDYALTEHVTIMGFSGSMDTSDVLPEETFAPKKLSRQFLDKTKLYLGDNGIQTLIEEGDCAKAILNAANKISADVIVMGSHSSRKWFENTIMGSITEKVLQNTTTPVLIIPTKKESKS